MLWRQDRGRLAGPRASCAQPKPKTPNPTEPKGWHSRGYLPHLDARQLTQFVTFRLADAVPKALIECWKNELETDTQHTTQSQRASALQKRVEQYADAGHGACHLRIPAIAQIVQTALLHFDGSRYRLLAWCVMPNHVHVLLELAETDYSLSAIVHSWKSYTVRKINKELDRAGTLWMPDYFDRYIRDQAHLDACINYIRHNPVKAGLVDAAEEWPYSG
ncbi:MAG: transposase [Nitrococcus sp.]|nr:transposase [Nitrococcus sp.]